MYSYKYDGCRSSNTEASVPTTTTATTTTTTSFKYEGTVLCRRRRWRRSDVVILTSSLHFWCVSFQGRIRKNQIPTKIKTEKISAHRSLFCFLTKKRISAFSIHSREHLPNKILFSFSLRRKTIRTFLIFWLKYPHELVEASITRKTWVFTHVTKVEEVNN